MNPTITIRILIITASICLLNSCVGGSDSSSESTAESFDFVAMMANIADTIIIPNYREAALKAGNLAAIDGPIDRYCAALDSPATEDDDPARDEAATAWRSLMQSWQRAELHRLGPVLDNNAALADRIHAYSNSRLNHCGVDQATVLATQPGFEISARAANQRGLAAVEYLLFNADLNHNCPPQIPETADWNDRPEAEKKRLRCDYAWQLAGDIEAAAASVEAAWDQQQGNYRLAFISKSNAQLSLESLSDALFFIETGTKDIKLGETLGLRQSCEQTACPEVVESPYAQSTLDNIRINLESFLRLFEGAEGLGFDDIIIREGFPAIAADFARETEDALALIDTMDTPLLIQAEDILNSGDASACENSNANPDTVQQVAACSLHGLIKRITDRLRSDFITLVNLDLPDRAQADND